MVVFIVQNVLMTLKDVWLINYITVYIDLKLGGIEMEDVQNNVVEETKVEGGTTETPVQEKTFTQTELEDIIAKRLARETKKIEAEKQKAMEAQLKAELEESAKLAKMSEAERLKAQAEKERKQFESERKKFEEEMRAFNAERILNTTMKTLNEKGLPVEFAPFIKADNAEDIMDNILAFEKGFKESVDKAVSERLRGKTPSVGVKNKNVDAFLEGFKAY